MGWWAGALFRPRHSSEGNRTRSQTPDPGNICPISMRWPSSSGERSATEAGRLLDVGGKVERACAGDHREQDAEPGEPRWPVQLVEHIAVHVFVTLRLHRIASRTRLHSPHMVGGDQVVVGFLVHAAEGRNGCSSLAALVISQPVAVGL